jgi:propanol-preferring alcohol dehydrogenase
MRAARFHPGEGLRIETVDRPEPGPGEVVVEVAGCGLCHSDLHLMDGDLPLTGPTTLGHEVAGRAAETGHGVGLDVGTEVAVFGGWGCREAGCPHCSAGLDQRYNLVSWMGIGTDGGYAEYVRVPTERYLLPLDGLNPAEAAPLTDAALTPDRTVRTAGDLGPADTVVVVHVGGLGAFGVQFAAMTGARVVAVDLDTDRLERAAALGAAVTVDASAARVPGAVKREAGRAAAVLDFVGSDETLGRGTNLLKTGCRLVLAGLAGGSVPFEWNPLVGSEVSFHTVSWGSLPELREVLKMARQGRLDWETVPVGFENLHETLERLQAGKVSGRAVLTPGA